MERQAFDYYEDRMNSAERNAEIVCWCIALFASLIIFSLIAKAVIHV